MAFNKETEITEWYTDYSDTIFRYIVMMTHDYQQAEDLTHDTFVKAYRSYDSFERNSSPKTWLYRIAHNLTIDAMRKRKPLFFFKNVFPTTDPAPLPEEVVQIKESSRELYQALGQLKVTYREVIILRKIKALSIQETAEILQWSESKVKMTLKRGLEALEEQLIKEGIGHEKTI